MNKSESIVEIAKAMSEFQKIVKQPLKDAKNPFFKSTYVPIQSVVEVVTVACAQVGLSFMQFPVSQDNKIGISTLVMHNSGEFIHTEPIFVTPTKQDPQAAGSAITYLRRYSLSAVFGITSDVDDDGNKASEPSTDIISAIKSTAIRLNVDAKELYEEVSTSLNINKKSNELSEVEKNSIISVLNKK